MKRGSHAIRTRWAVWFPVLIAVFGALAPTVSHAIALEQSGTASTIQICTPQGMSPLLFNQMIRPTKSIEISTPIRSARSVLN